MSEHAERMSLRPRDGESADETVERVVGEAVRRNAVELLVNSLVSHSVVDTRWIADDWSSVDVVIGRERYTLTLEISTKGEQA